MTSTSTRPDPARAGAVPVTDENPRGALDVPRTAPTAVLQVLG
jgi:hypothetical protein